MSSIMRALLQPLPRSLALTRLKSNLFLTFLLFCLRTVFTPYLAIRRTLVELGDEIQGRRGGQRSWVGSGIGGAETLLLLILLWNITEAVVSLRYPRPVKSDISGMVMTPTKISSPITRPYSPTKPSSSSNNNHPSTPTRTPLPPTYSTPQSRLQNKDHTPTRSSPLSASTAKILNLPRGSGVNNNESPSKLNQSLIPSSAPGGGAGGDFVMIEREEREWVDNVWRGVRGKGGKVGL